MADKVVGNETVCDEEKALAMSVVDAAKSSNISRSKLYEALQSGELEAKKLGRRTIILRKSLEKYLASLPNFNDSVGASGC